jgi:hypothetical protein
MNKKKIALQAFSLLMVFTIIGVKNVSAETATSDATVTFTQNTNPVAPLDPLNPDQPGAGPGTDMAGPLSLDYVPTLPFGSKVITGNVETYKTTNTKPYIQVSDTRGTGAGWVVKANLAEFKDTTDGTKTLPGAISFGNTQIITSTNNTSTAPTGGNFTLTGGASDITIFSAATNEGLATWLQTWLSTTPNDPEGNDNVTLEINTAGAYTRTYLSTITWTIEVAP